MIIQELQNCIKDKPCLLGMMKACQEEVPTSVGMSHVTSCNKLLQTDVTSSSLLLIVHHGHLVIIQVFE